MAALIAFTIAAGLGFAFHEKFPTVEGRPEMPRVCASSPHATRGPTDYVRFQPPQEVAAYHSIDYADID
jgi:hypothetical protein